MKTAILIGATGLIGKQILAQLLNNSTYSEIRVFARRSTGIEHPKLKTFIIDFDHLEQYKNDIKGDVLYSTLGTTLKIAGSQERQYEIDFDYQFNVAKIAAENGVAALVLLSSIGANPNASIFYSKMKGALDLAVKNLPFKHISILRPSMLEGNRENKRLMETLFTPVMKSLVVVPCWRKYRPIKDHAVAKAMINAADYTKTAYEIYESTYVFLLADMAQPDSI